MNNERNKEQATKIVAKSEEINAPFIKLEEWRKEKVPPEIWNNPYLAAYRKKRQTVDSIAVGLITLAAIFAGMFFEYGLIAGKW